MTLSPYSIAAERGTADEAISMVKRAVALIKTKGRENAFAEFDNPKGAFVDRDLYIAVLDEKGVMVAHGANPKLINKSLIDLKDANDKLFIKELVDTAQKKGSGWVDYKWVNPTNKTIESKSTYIEKVGDIAVACGIYK
jgi:signal transduction histidine kinase